MEAANKAYGDLYSYMNTLNTDSKMHEVLVQVFADKSIVSKFTPDEYASAMVFLKDFQKSGIHLPAKKKEEFVALSDQIIHLGREFIQANPRAIEQVKISQSALNGVSPNMMRRGMNKDGYVYVPTDSGECQMILKYAKNENVRRQVYESMNSATKESIHVLEELLGTRSKLATLVGFDSYSSLQLQDKMAKNPSTFLCKWSLNHLSLITYFRYGGCIFEYASQTSRTNIQTRFRHITANETKDIEFKQQTYCQRMGSRLLYATLQC